MFGFLFLLFDKKTLKIIINVQYLLNQKNDK